MNLTMIPPALYQPVYLVTRVMYFLLLCISLIIVVLRRPIPRSNTFIISLLLLDISIISLVLAV